MRPAPSSPLAGFDVLIEGHDSLSDYLTDALEARGLHVRRRVRGGGPRTLALITFTFRDVEPPGVTWFNVRLADTRTGAIVAAVSAPLDSLGPTVAARAQSLADSLTRTAP